MDLVCRLLPGVHKAVWKSCNETEKKKSGLNVVLVYWYQRTKQEGKGHFYMRGCGVFGVTPVLVREATDGETKCV